MTDLIFIDSLYPAVALSKEYVLGAPEVIIGSQTKDFVWGENALFFPNKENGGLQEVEGLLLVRVTLPRKVAAKLKGIPFLPSKIRQKSVVSECFLCLQNDNRFSLCQHSDFERSFVDVYTIYELVGFVRPSPYFLKKNVI